MLEFQATHTKIAGECSRPGSISRKSRIELGDVTPHNIKQLKRLNQVIFPVSYNDKFYKDVLEVGELAKLAYFNDIAVGAVCCRVDHSQNQKRLYIMTLGCLAPYRRLGIGTKMLNHVLNICEKDGTFDNIYLYRRKGSSQLVAYKNCWRTQQVRWNPWKFIRSQRFGLRPFFRTVKGRGRCQNKKARSDQQ
ncbi:N-alpha-acetyltransferase 50 isoform X3 [Mobula birostris]|uniref:N-alpha-acetyltransferase 50 isoform X3 n=1 Tax=Mobula birostris TaxID=1983395 RepID=UPI003B28AA4B